MPSSGTDPAHPGPQHLSVETIMKRVPRPTTTTRTFLPPTGMTRASARPSSGRWAEEAGEGGGRAGRGSELAPSPGVPGADPAAVRDAVHCGRVHLCRGGEGLRPGERVDVLCVLRSLLRLPHCPQLLRRLPAEAPLEPGCTGNPAPAPPPRSGGVGLPPQEDGGGGLEAAPQPKAPSPHSPS